MKALQLIRESRNLFILLVTFCFVNNSVAQFKLEGKVVDSNTQPLSSVVVTIRLDSVITETLFTDSLGNFHTILNSNDTYFISTKYLDVKIDTTINFNQNTAILLVVPTNISLDEFVVQRKKSKVTHGTDGMLFNISEMASQYGQTLLDIISKTPGVRVSGSSIQVTGKLNCLFYIDDRLLNKSGQDLFNYLGSIQSDEVKNIEVILTPPASYDVDGKTGIILIRLKKNRKKGYHVDLYSRYKQNTYDSESSGGDFTYNKAKSQFQASLFCGQFKQGNRFQNSVQSEFIEWMNDVYSKNNERDIFFTTQWNQQLHKRTKLSLFSEYGHADVTNHSNNELVYGNQLKPSSKQETQQNYSIQSNIINSSVFIVHDFDSLNRKVSFDMNWLEQGLGNKMIYKTTENSTYSYLNTEELQGIRIISSNLDLELPTKSVDLNFGTKINGVLSNNSINYNGDLPPTLLMTNSFEYHEFTHAYYVEIHKRWAKLSAKLGFRMESNSVKLISINTSESLRFKFMQYLPQLSSNYELNAKNSIGIAIGKRNNRPNFRELNPFRQYDNPKSFSQGNPALQPSISTNLEVSYIHESKLYISFSLGNMQNGFSQLSNFDSLTLTNYYYPLNYLNGNDLSSSISYSYTNSKWFEGTLNLSVSYFNNQSTAKQTIRSKAGFVSFLESNNSIQLNKTKTVLIELNGWIQSPTVNGFEQLKTMGNLDFGMRLLLLKKQLTCSVFMSDIFKTRGYRTLISINNNRFYNQGYLDSRQLNLSLTYSFGNDKIQSTELNRKNQTEKERTY